MRSFVPFEGIWAMPIEVPYSFLVKDGDLAWTCGQLPLDRASRVRAPGDLAAQTEIVCDYIAAILVRAGLRVENIGKLLLYYVPGKTGDAERMLSLSRERFGPRPVLVPIAVPYFYYRDLLLEVDVFAGSPGGRVIKRSGAGAEVQVTDGGELAWASITLPPDALTAGSELLEEALAEIGLRLNDRLSDHWIAPANSATAAELRRLDLLTDEGGLIAGPAEALAVIGDLTFVKGAAAMAATAASASADLRIFTRRKGRFAWLSARASDNRLGLVPQTERLMTGLENSLKAMGLGFDKVVKSTSHYVGSAAPEELRDNMAVRNAYYRKPGPASTGLPVFALADADSRIAVDILAVLDA